MGEAPITRGSLADYLTSKAEDFPPFNSSAKAAEEGYNAMSHFKISPELLASIEELQAQLQNIKKRFAYIVSDSLIGKVEWDKVSDSFSPKEVWYMPPRE